MADFENCRVLYDIQMKDPQNPVCVEKRSFKILERSSALWNMLHGFYGSALRHRIFFSCACGARKVLYILFQWVRRKLKRSCVCSAWRCLLIELYPFIYQFHAAGRHTSKYWHWPATQLSWKSNFICADPHPIRVRNKVKKASSSNTIDSQDFMMQNTTCF